jgi:hypothetical protein
MLRALEEYPAKSQLPIQVLTRNPSVQAVSDTAQRPWSEGGLRILISTRESLLSTVVDQTIDWT